MSAIVIDLQEGFDGEKVILQMDDAEVFKSIDVRTRYQIGLADTVTLDLPPGPHVLMIALPERSLSATAEFDSGKAGFIGISRLENRLEISVSPEPFRYA